MKPIISLFIAILILPCFTSAQIDSIKKSSILSDFRNITIEPAIGFEPISDVIVSNLVQWNVKKRLGLISYTSYAYNNSLQREINSIKTNFNYTISQKFGVGTTFYTKNSSNTFSFLAGLRYDTYKETLENPEYDEVSVSVNTVSPDLGMMYNLKVGKKKYFFSYRMYLPLYPYPFNTTDIWALGDNIANLSLEFGLGIRLK